MLIATGASGAARFTAWVTSMDFNGKKSQHRTAALFVAWDLWYDSVPRTFDEIRVPHRHDGLFEVVDPLARVVQVGAPPPRHYL